MPVELLTPSRILKVAGAVFVKVASGRMSLYQVRAGSLVCAKPLSYCACPPRGHERAL